MPRFFSLSKSEQGNTQQLDNEPACVCFKQFIEDAQAKRKQFLQQLDAHDINKKVIEQHLERIKTLQALPIEARSAQDMLMAIVNDIAIFPELYLDYNDELDHFYQLLDKNDCHVYYTSIQRFGPMKSHGCVAIGSPTMAQGIVFAAAGDPRRGKIKLPTDFRSRLIAQLQQLDPLPPQVVHKYGTKKEIIDLLKSCKSLDSYGMRQLLTHCEFKDLLQEYVNKIQFNMKYSQGFELWSKPRSGLQYQDTLRFNQHFPVFLADQSESCVTRPFSSLHHVVTRHTAIRPQTHVASSTVLKHWLAMTAHQKKIDEQRTLIYSNKSSFWKFDMSALSVRAGNCNTISTHLLGALPKTASIANWGTTKGLSVIVPRINMNVALFKKSVNEIMETFIVYLQRFESSFNEDDFKELIRGLKVHHDDYLRDNIDFQTYRTGCKDILYLYKDSLSHVVVHHRRTVFTYIVEFVQSLFSAFNKLVSLMKKSDVADNKTSSYRQNIDLKKIVCVFETKLEALVQEMEMSLGLSKNLGSAPN